MVQEGYKMTELGEIPVDWDVVSTEDIISNQKGAIKIGPFGSQLKKNILVDSGKKVYGQENVYRNDFQIGDRYITDDKFNELKTCEIKPGNIVISMMGTVGKCAIVPNTIKQGIMDSHLLKLDIDEKKYDQKMLVHLIQSSNIVKKQIRKLSVGGIMEGLSSTIVKQLKYPSPPLEEQQKIADILSAVDEQLEQTDQLIEKTKELKKGLMQKLLTKGIGHTEFKQTEVGEIPVEWEIQSLGEIGEFYKGKGIGKKDISNNGVKCILYGQLYTTYKESIKAVNTFTNVKINNPAIGQINDLLIPSSGETAIDIATASALNIDDVYIGGDINIFRPSNMIDSNYLSYQISSTRKSDLAKLAQGSTVYHLYAPSLKKFKVVVPPIKEQQKIADILSSVDDQLDEYNTKKEKLKLLKKGLMQQLLTGEIRVSV